MHFRRWNCMILHTVSPKFVSVLIASGSSLFIYHVSWWRHQMETFSASLAICANSPVTGEFPAQRPVTQSFDFFFDLRLNKRLSKPLRGWWFESHGAHYDVTVMKFLRLAGFLPTFMLFEMVHEISINLAVFRVSRVLTTLWKYTLIPLIHAFPIILATYCGITMTS